MRILSLMILVTLLVACSGESEDITFYNGKYQYTKPADWSNFELNEVAEVEVGNVYSEQYMVIIVEDKSAPELQISIDAYAGLVKAGFIETIGGFQEVGPNNIKLLDYDGYKYVYTGTLNNLGIKYWHIIVDTGNDWIQFLFWSTRDDFEKGADKFQAVLDSFKQL